MIYNEDIKKMIDIGRRIYRRGLVSGTSGNLSIRVDENHLVITSGGCNLGNLATDDLVIIDMEGRAVSGSKTPSSEYLMHLYIYKKRPDIFACCHTHPPYTTAFAVSGKELPSGTLPEVITAVGDIALTDYAAPGTDAVPASLKPYVAQHDAFLLRNHGALTIGRSLHEAYNRMETVEHYARIIYIAGQLGGPLRLEADEIRRLEKIRDSLK